MRKLKVAQWFTYDAAISLYWVNNTQYEFVFSFNKWWCVCFDKQSCTNHTITWTVAFTLIWKCWQPKFKSIADLMVVSENWFQVRLEQCQTHCCLIRTNKNNETIFRFMRIILIDQKWKIVCLLTKDRWIRVKMKRVYFRDQRHNLSIFKVGNMFLVPNVYQKIDFHFVRERLFSILLIPYR